MRFRRFEFSDNSAVCSLIKRNFSSGFWWEISKSWSQNLHFARPSATANSFAFDSAIPEGKITEKDVGEEGGGGVGGRLRKELW